MKKEFVPCKQALTLKELGFDEPCFTKFENYFDKTKLEPIIVTLSLNTPYENEYHGYDQKIINDTEKRWAFTGYKNSVKDHNNNIVSAPTFSQAFSWFREKHNLFHSIKPLAYNMSLGLVGPLGNLKACNVPEYGTYEEAELACLDELIRLIKEKNVEER